MNLSVNLIEDSEKRHGGSLSILLVLRIAALVAPLLIVLLIGQLLVSLTLSRSQLESTEGLISDKKDQVALSGEVRKQQKQYQDLINQLNTWQAMRVDWHARLEPLRHDVPVEVQLTSLKLVRTLSVTNGLPLVKHRMLLSGKTGGATPEANLTRFRQNVLKDESLTNILDDVVVPEGTFVEDTSPGARPTDRLFELNCTFNPRVFK